MTDMFLVTVIIFQWVFIFVGFVTCKRKLELLQEDIEDLWRMSDGQWKKIYNMDWSITDLLIERKKKK